MKINTIEKCKVGMNIISCTECEKVYIGETLRCLKTHLWTEKNDNNRRWFKLLS